MGRRCLDWACAVCKPARRTLTRPLKPVRRPVRFQRGLARSLVANGSVARRLRLSGRGARVSPGSRTA
eukprot:2182609-Lingulodinium_polyedra.AAC.1